MSRPSRYRPTVVNEGPPAAAPRSSFWELLDAGSLALMDFEKLEHALDYIRHWPRRTRFTIRHWMPVQPRGHELDCEWAVWVELSGTVRRESLRRGGVPRRTPGAD